MKETSYTVAVLQLAFSAQPDDNLQNTLSWVTKAAQQGGQVLCLPELCRSQYFCQQEDSSFFDLAETIPGPSTMAFQQAARELGVAIVLPLFEKRAPGLYHNSVALIDADGSLLGVYRKMHIPDDPGYYEKYYFTPGDLGFRAFATAFGMIGTLICWDQWYPEAARLTALQGASVLTYPTAIGWHPAERERHGEAQRDSWLVIQRAHAIANGVYVAAANRIGLEQPQGGGEGIQFWGSSFICNPQGVVLAQASEDREEILLAEVNPRQLEIIRRNWPFLRDRRIDAYDGITRRFQDADS
ncbi:MAG: acyltransferase [Desulfobulbaceae bacterium A2]|nr:MAG: acyltransferase [Desulfobulbaceae bacterium A2]